MGSAPQPISADPALAKKLGLQPLKSDVGTSFDTQNRPDLSRFKAHIVSLNAEQYSIDPSDTPLPEPSNRLTSSSMTVAREEMNAKIDGVRSELRADVAELRADVRSLQATVESRFQAIDSKFEAVGARLSALPTTWTLITTVAGGVVATIGLVFTMLTYAGDQSNVASQQQAQITETRAISDQNAKQISELNGKLDRVLTALEKQPPAPPQQ